MLHQKFKSRDRLQFSCSAHVNNNYNEQRPRVTSKSLRPIGLAILTGGRALPCIILLKSHLTCPLVSVFLLCLESVLGRMSLTLDQLTSNPRYFFRSLATKSILQMQSNVPTLCYFTYFQFRPTFLVSRCLLPYQENNKTK